MKPEHPKTITDAGEPNPSAQSAVPTARPKKYPRYLPMVVKLSFTVGALVVVFKRIALQDIQSVLASVAPGWLLVAAVLFTFSKWVSAHRLNHFFRAVSIPLTNGENLRLYWLGMFYNLFLPGGIGGDGYKAYLLGKKFGGKARQILRAILLDRFSGLFALLALTSLLFFCSSFPPAARVGSLLFIPLVLGTGYLFTRLFFREFTSVCFRTWWQSGLVQVAQVTCAWAILYATKTQGQTVDYLLVFLVSSVVAVLPFTIGGIGARELTFVVGARLLHLNAPASVTLSLLFYLITAVTSLPGAFFNLSKKG
jgi:glycosyltransferase 2 family protein